MKSKGKIVLIENAAALREALSELLEISGYQVATASNGKEGCGKIFESLPDLVICDINMPEMNGYEVLSIVKKRIGENLAPTFLFLTTQVQLDDIKQGLKLGADDYIAKPFITTDLLESIEMRLEKRRKLLNHSVNIHSVSVGGLGKLGLPLEKGLR